MSSDLPIVAGFDIASSTGVCWGRLGDAPQFDCVKFSKHSDDDLDASWRAQQWAIEWTKEHRPDRAVIEAPIEVMRGGDSNAHTILKLHGLYHVIGAVLKARRIPLRVERVQTVRKAFIGHGNLPGPEAKKRVMERCQDLRWRPRTYDEADAGAVFYYGCYQIKPEIMLRMKPLMMASRDEPERSVA